MHLSKQKQKYLHSLQTKKGREKNGKYIVEGKKSIETYIQSGTKIEELFGTTCPSGISRETRFVEVEPQELRQVSSLVHPEDYMAVVSIPEVTWDMFVSAEKVLFLDEVQTPGNVGTILRLMDWYGIHHCILGEGSADPFSPKCVQATMGALCNVHILRASWQESMERLKLPWFGAILGGKSLYASGVQLPEKGVLCMGNESRGISEELQGVLSESYAIPRAPTSVSESLNVAMASGIFLSDWSRTMI